MADNPNRIAVLGTTIGDPLIIRANPTEEAVRGVVAEVMRRYRAGEVGGPSGLPSQKVVSAHFYVDELSYLDGAAVDADIDISDLLNG